MTDDDISHDPVPDPAAPAQLKKGKKNRPNPDEMTFLDHLEDLRWTIVRAVVALFVMLLLVSAFFFEIRGWLEWPLRFAVGEDYQDLLILSTRSVFDVISVIFYITIFGSLILAGPFWLYFGARFIAPGLTEKELKILRPGCVAAFILFLVGCAFSFFILSPITFKFIVFMNVTMNYDMVWSPTSYYGTLVWMVLGVGLSFEFPLVIVLLSYLGIVTTEMLKNYRRHALVGFLCLTAIVTPSIDPVTFVVMAVPMYGLYEASILVSKRMEERHARAEAEFDAEAETG